ncbi:MAG: hypothetical protein ACRDJ4_15950 [Actinomycetota bacterium]
MQCDCGQVLVQAVGEESLKTLGGEEVPFRRRTDYLLCPVCLKLYPCDQLRKLYGDDVPCGDVSVVREEGAAEELSSLAGALEGPSPGSE